MVHHAQRHIIYVMPIVMAKEHLCLSLSVCLLIYRLINKNYILRWIEIVYKCRVVCIFLSVMSWLRICWMAGVSGACTTMLFSIIIK